MQRNLKPIGPVGIAQIKNIVTHRQAGPVQGHLVDAYTASMLSQVYDGLKPENQTRFLSLPLPAAVKIGWQIVRKAGA